MEVHIEVLSITRSRKASALADVKIRITFDPSPVIPDCNAGVIDIDDLRVLRNKRDVLWVAMPTYSLQDGPKNYRYEKVVDVSRGLARQIDDAVLAAYEVWDVERSQKAVQNGR